MGRRPTKPNAVPRLRARKRGNKTWYYYDHGGTPRREESLGCDYGVAIQRWAEIEREAKSPRVQQSITFRWVAGEYRANVLPTKAPRTQRDNASELAKLIAFFDDPPAPLEAITPQHVRQYLTWRSSAPVRAKREKALLSHIWNFARDRGYTALANPCAGIRTARELGREVYIEDTEYGALWQAASAPLRDALDLAYLTGQRPSDVLKMMATDIRDGHLQVRQGKTRAALRIEITADLQAVLHRIAARKQQYAVHSLRLVVNEHGREIKIGALQKWFRAARTEAGLPHLQFRDLRAKAGTDKADSSGDIRKAQAQLGHSSVTMTEHYVRNRRGSKVTPTK
jgi:integrase